MTTTNEHLRLLMEQFDLGGVEINRVTISHLAQVSKSAVDAWLIADTSAYFRAMPERSRRLIALELGLEKPISTKMKVERKK